MGFALFGKDGNCVPEWPLAVHKAVGILSYHVVFEEDIQQSLREKASGLIDFGGVYPRQHKLVGFGRGKTKSNTFC